MQSRTSINALPHSSFPILTGQTDSFPAHIGLHGPNLKARQSDDCQTMGQRPKHALGQFFPRWIASQPSDVPKSEHRTEGTQTSNSILKVPTFICLELSSGHFPSIFYRTTSQTFTATITIVIVAVTYITHCFILSEPIPCSEPECSGPYPFAIRMLHFKRTALKEVESAHTNICKRTNFRFEVKTSPFLETTAP